jgi:hypothetical protein
VDGDKRDKMWMQTKRITCGCGQREQNADKKDKMLMQAKGIKCGCRQKG